MTRTIQIAVGDLVLTGSLNKTESAKALFQCLPIEGLVSRWGQEIYFNASVPVNRKDPAYEVVEVGTVAYWPPGNALCLFWGPTPVSKDHRPCAASPVILLGQFQVDTEALNLVRDGELIRVNPLPAP